MSSTTAIPSPPKRKPTDDPLSTMAFVPLEALQKIPSQYTASIELWTRHAPSSSQNPDRDQTSWRHAAYLDLSVREQAARREIVREIRAITGGKIAYWTVIPISKRPERVPKSPMDCSGRMLETIRKCLKEGAALTTTVTVLSRLLSCLLWTLFLRNQGR